MRKSYTILVADDCIIHTQSLEQALAAVGLNVRVNIVHDGQGAVHYLSRDPALDLFDEFPAPTLLLLDLEMPNMDGFAVLNWVRAQPKYKELPIVVLSGSSDMEGVRKAYALGANGYFVKPFSDRDYTSLVECLKQFLSAVTETSTP